MTEMPKIPMPYASPVSGRDHPNASVKEMKTAIIAGDGKLFRALIAMVAEFS